MTAREIAERNKFVGVYPFKYDYSTLPPILNYDDQPESIKKIIEGDVLLAQHIIAEREQRPGIRMGDFLERPDGVRTRITYLYDGHLQDGGGAGSFYMGRGGWVSYSGGLDPGYDIADILPTNEVLTAEFWTFSEGWARGNGGFYFDAPCRLFYVYDKKLHDKWSNIHIQKLPNHA